METPVEGVPDLEIGQCRFGVYAFNDYDGEPIYVGQTWERLSGRVRRHLTNRRTDAVAMSVLDPFEVYAITLWPLPEFQLVKGSAKNPTPEFRAAASHLNALEAGVFADAQTRSKFKAVLNEKYPTSETVVALPKSYSGVIVTEGVKKLREHPDVRLARRAATIARLALIISERKVKPGLRRTLKVQADRLSWLAAQRLAALAADVAAEDRAPGPADGDDETDAG
jgi:hypothetical protein